MATAIPSPKVNHIGLPILEYRGNKSTLCAGCGHQVSVTAGTVFQDTRTPLTVWFRAMWWVTSQKNGVSALGLQQVLGWGSYQTAWTMLHKLRRAMVRPDRSRLKGRVEVDETFWGAPEEGAYGRGAERKVLIAVGAEEDGEGIGRIRMGRIPNASGKSLERFVRESIDPGSVVGTEPGKEPALLSVKPQVARRPPFAKLQNGLWRRRSDDLC